MKRLSHTMPIGLAILTTFCLQYPVAAAEMSSTVPLELEKPSYVAPWQRYTGRRWKQIDWKGFSNMRHEVPSPISAYKNIETPIKGNPENGKKLVANKRRGGGCVACHIFPDTQMPGNIGPDFSSIGTWKRPDAYLFNYIYDPRLFNPNTTMPPWGAHNILSQDEIKDIVVYLQTLTEVADKTPIDDDPDKRPIPVDTRDNLDEFENPAMLSVELGEELFNTLGSTNQSCLSCHAGAVEKAFTTWAATMPKFETRLNKIIGIEEFITRHARATTGADYLAQSEENLALAIYLRYLANGQAIAIDQNDANTQAAIKRGKTLMERKIGQLNRSCTDCHITNVEKWIRGQYLVRRERMYDHFPTYRTSRGAIWDIRKRFQWCGAAIRANELPPDASEYGDIEIYLAILNNGRVLNVPGLRH